MATNLRGKKYQEHVTISSDYPRLTSWGINFCKGSLRMIERQLLFVLEVCKDFIVSALSGKRQSFPWSHSCCRLWFTTYISRQVYLTNRFQVAVRLFSNRSQRTSKCGKNISDTLGCASCATFLLLPHLRTATWNLFVNCKILSGNPRPP